MLVENNRTGYMEKGTCPGTEKGTCRGTEKGTSPGTEKGTCPGTENGTSPGAECVGCVGNGCNKMRSCQTCCAGSRIVHCVLLV